MAVWFTLLLSGRDPMLGPTEYLFSLGSICYISCNHMHCSMHPTHLIVHSPSQEQARAGDYVTTYSGTMGIEHGD